MPKQSDDLFKDLGDSDSGREGSVAERNRKVRGKLCRNASMESMLGEGLEREEVAGAGGSAVVEDGGGGARMDGGGRELNAASGKGGGDEGCAEGVVVGSAEDGRCVDFGGGEYCDSCWKFLC